MRDFLLTLVIFSSIPIIFVKPHVGVLVWSWIAYMNLHQFTWGFALNFRFAFLVGVATIVAWLISREPKRIPWNGTTASLAAFAVWISFTTLFAIYPDEAYSKWDRAIKILLFNGFVTLALMRSRERVNALIWVIVVSIGLYGVKGGVFTLLTGGHYLVWGPPHSFIADNNALALALVMIVPLMRYLQTTTQARWIRWGLGAAMMFCLIAVLGTHSRGGILALAVLCLVLWWKSRKKLVISLAIGVTLAVAVIFMPDEWTSRMETIKTFQEDPSVQARFNAWGYALDVTTRSPIVGGGFGAFLGNKPDDDRLVIGTNAHSIFFEVLGEHGYVGLALFLLFGIGGLRTGTWIIRNTRNHAELLWARDLAAMGQVSLITYAAAGSFQNLAFFDLFYHIVVILVLVKFLVVEALPKLDHVTPQLSARVGVGILRRSE